MADQAMRVKKYGESMKLSDATSVCPELRQVALEALPLGERSCRHAADICRLTAEVLAQPVDPVILRDLGLDSEAARGQVLARPYPSLSTHQKSAFNLVVLRCLCAWDSVAKQPRICLKGFCQI
jgi:hypothetical protein